MLVVVDLNVLPIWDDLGGVSSSAGEEKETEFVPLTLAPRGRGLH